MKTRILLVTLLLVALGLGFGLYQRHRRAEWQRQSFEASMTVLSNDLNLAQQRLDEQTQVNTRLETELGSRGLAITNLHQQVTELTNLLQKTVAEAQADAEAARLEMAQRDARIAALEGERDQLTHRMSELNTSITNLETEISETQRKLAASEGDREFLLKELKRLQAEKAELERQFNDLAVLREQVKKLKEELSIARRLDWIRRGLYGSDLKGAERLQKGFATAPRAQTNIDLNVEIHRDGPARILSPTNTPPAP